MLLNLAVPVLLIIPIVLAGSSLFRGASGRAPAFALRFLKTQSHVEDSWPGATISLAGDAPITLNGFDPRREALLVQLPDGTDAPGKAAGFSIRSNPSVRGTDLLFRDRVIVRLPGVAPDRSFDLYVENATA